MQGSANYSIHVSPVAQQIVLSPGDPNAVTPLPDDTVGVAITDFDIVASGGTGPYTFTVGGTLPAGLEALSDNNDTLRITGTPTEAGDFAFSVSAVDSLGAQARTTRFAHAVK